MPAYDSSFHPPALVADVTVIHPVTGADSGALRGKLDTGADVTVIPERLVGQLGLTPKGLLWTRGYDGTYSQRPVYYTRMTVEDFRVAAVRCIAIARDDPEPEFRPLPAGDVHAFVHAEEVRSVVGVAAALVLRGLAERT